jgi:branched-chain amino acid transport system substrate-binding protein
VSEPTLRPRYDRLRRGTVAALTVTLAATLLGPCWAKAAGSRPPLKIGVSLALTGPDARWGIPMLRGVELAVEEVNRGGGPGGQALETVILDSAGPGLEGVSRWRGTDNYQRLIADPAVIAVIGPMTSGEGRAVAPLLSHADLATITPSSTTFDLTDAAFRERLRPGGRAVYFRAVGTDLAQAEAMADFAHSRLGVHRLVLIDDGRDFGERMIAMIARRARELGMTVLGRRRLSWRIGDHRSELRELKALEPQAVYYAGGYQVGLQAAQQVAEVLPRVERLGAESLFNSAFPGQAGHGAAEGWYVSNVAPDPTAGTPVAAWADRFRRRFGESPTAYSLTAYTAVTVIGRAVGRVIESGRPVTRASVREAIQRTRLPDTLQGSVSFDANGDLEHPLVSIYQVERGSFRYVETVSLARAPSWRAEGARP